MDVFDDQEEEETKSDCTLTNNLSKELLEDNAMTISKEKVTNDEKHENQETLRKLQKYFFISDSYNGSTICKRCGKTYRSTQEMSIMIQHMNKCELDCSRMQKTI